VEILFLASLARKRLKRIAGLAPEKRFALIIEIGITNFENYVLETSFFQFPFPEKKNLCLYVFKNYTQKIKIRIIIWV
jgi:hypothetical protein